MYSPLPKIEILAYFIISISVMWFFTFHVYLSGIFFMKFFGSNFGLEPGWSILNRLQDTSDGEWASWKSYMFQVLPLLILHLLLSKLCRYMHVYAVSFSHIFITLMFITFYVSLNVALLFLLSTVILFLTSLTRSTVLIWVVGILLLVFNQFDVFNVIVSLDYHRTLLTEISFAWFILKSIAFSFNKSEDHQYEKFLNFIAYAFYLPTFFFGPFIPYENFLRGLHSKCFDVYSLNHLYKFLLNILRYSFWALLIEIASHYIYCSALHYHINSIISQNLWTLNGTGFCLAQFFYLKYLVFYGLAGSIAKFEGFDAPPPPKCISRVHLYSKMWRYFDRGYYLFTFNYIYRPICKKPSCSTGRKFFASIVSFTFVFLWHGLTYTVFYWSLFNFLGITCEAIGKYFCSTPIYENFITLRQTPQNVRRISCLFASPLWVLGAISNYFFFGGHKYAFKCINQFVFYGDWNLYLYTFLVAYSMCQLSVEVENLEFFKQKKSHIRETHKSM